MKEYLYLFNPDHDLALANHQKTFMPPLSAKELAEDLAALPYWYASPSSTILMPNDCNYNWLNEMNNLFAENHNFITQDEVVQKKCVIKPWGWNNSLLGKLSNVHEFDIPFNLDLLRRYSHRSTAVHCLSLLSDIDGCIGTSHYCQSLAEVKKWVTRYKSCVLKMPLSGSGKGLVWCRGGLSVSQEKWTEKIIKKQSGIILEPILNKVVDFAVEYKISENGELSKVGYSFFETKNGTYRGNHLLSDDEILSHLADYINLDSLQEVEERISLFLEENISTFYQGYLGIDMMICLDSPRVYKLHPCVEINLRTNMGVVAHNFYSHFAEKGAKGFFHISYFKNNVELNDFHHSRTISSPLKVENHKWVRGYLPLVPISSNSKYLAYVDSI